jgi:hypothetical protein
MTILSISTPIEHVRTGFLLVDPSNLDDEMFSDAVPMLDCTPASMGQSAHLMPRLIDVAALSTKEQDGLQEILMRELQGERPPTVCAWLECATDAKVLARHVARFLIGPGPDGGPVYWRYFDPCVFVLVLQVFSNEQRQALLGPITEWRFAWCCRWWRVIGSEVTADPLLGRVPGWPTARQWRSLESTDSIARALPQALDCLGGARSTDDVCLELLAKIDASILDARTRLHLSDSDDLVEYALQYARYGDRFQQHPKLSAAWGELAEGRISWSELVSMLNPDDYQALDREASTLSIVIGDE